MSSSPAVYGQFGQTLAFAERALTDRLGEQLARRDTEPATWYALRLIATRGPRVSRQELTALLAGSRTLDPESARALLTRLADEALVRGDAEIELTDAGGERYRSLRDDILGPATELLSQFPLADVETTVQTLRAITELATEEPVRAASD
jgi:hypothetical protein